MFSPLSKTPFLFLLIPLLVGILLEYYLDLEIWSIFFFLTGGLIMLLSYLNYFRDKLIFRWLFGAGVFLFVLGLGLATTSYNQHQSTFLYSGQSDTYQAMVINLPEEKPQTLAYQVELSDMGRRVICYIALDSLHDTSLELGDVFLFNAKIEPFQNQRGSSFDYVSYMHNKGFVGMTYISPLHWKKVGEDFSLKIEALKLRSNLLSFYKSLGFTPVEYAILSALTLGYQDELSEDVLQGFRTTGTVHVLSVSGLHVGIIFVAITFLLSFIGRTSKAHRLKPILIILLLWSYAFITGLSPSVIRASTMLSVYCMSQLVDRQRNALYSLYITAFFMLLFSPLFLFDVGFQLSFVSVLGILYLYERIVSKWNIKNKLGRTMWQMFCISLVAQLATFPLCLYYFGTFPTYFFVTNLVIVPLVTLITYTLLVVLLASLFASASLLQVLVILLKYEVGILTGLIHFFENLPYALVENVHLSFLDLILVSILVLSFSSYILTRKGNRLTISLASVLLMIVFYTLG